MGLKNAVLCVLVSGMVFVGQAFADVPAYELIKDKSVLKFFAIQNGANVEGKFTDFTADIRFDPEHLAESSIKVEINIGSITMPDDDIVKNLKMPEWLSVTAFPKATYVSKKITRMPGTDNYYANGDLTLKGISKPVVLNFQMEHFDEKRAIATGYVTLHRKEFTVGQGDWAKDDVIKDEVRVEFRVAADKK